MIRSIFISLFVCFIAFALIWSGLRFFTNTEELYLFALFVSSLILSSYFIGIYIFKPNNVQLTTLAISSATGAATLIIAGDILLNHAGNNLAIYIALGLFIGWIIYNVWYAKPNRKLFRNNLKGKSFPEISLFDGSGAKQDITIDGKQKLIVFHRADWCPFCSAQIDELLREHHAFQSTNTDLYFISINGKATTNKSALNSENMHFLEDKDGNIAREIGIIQANGSPFGLSFFGFSRDSIFPTTFLLDESNQIIHHRVFKDYRSRQPSSYYLRILNA